MRDWAHLRWFSDYSGRPAKATDKGRTGN
jgi:hypothetical protein